LGGVGRAAEALALAASLESSIVTSYRETKPPMASVVASVFLQPE
jgi:Asp/Glu/hydantoin racemase